jgi:1-acyl-sn-glycerol-3-phosphate acyltransferase
MTGYGVLHVVGFRKLMRQLYRVEVIGGDRIPREGACILTPNHESVVDPFLPAVATTRPIHYMTKAELFRFRPLAAILRWLGTFPVERGSGDRTAMTEAAQLLERGALLGIFPQGTSRQLVRRWHRGAARLALTTGATLVPVYMTGTRAFPFRSRVRIEVREPIPVAPAKPSVVAARALTRQIEEAMQA